MKNIVIYGAGGLGRELLGLVNAIDPQKEEWHFLGYIDDNNSSNNSLIIGDSSWFDSLNEPVSVVLGIASPQAKARIYDKLQKSSLVEFPILIHPQAYVEPSATLAQGCVISAFCFVAVESSLGICSFLNAGAQLGHDSKIGNFTSLMPQASVAGNVTIGDKTFVGMNASILQGLTIGTDVTVGIGSVLLNNVPDGVTVMGYPARIIQKANP